jgi:hypothetical protein
MKTFFIFIALFINITNSNSAQNNYSAKKLLIRCDDIGMSHSVNMAAKELIEEGLIFSASVMFPCAWYQEAVDILKDHPEISVGVHLTLNAEWKNYRWGPVAGKDNVSSLVDDNGFFFPSRSAFFSNNPKLDEVEIELRAQIERAVKSGLKISYLDYHMGTAVDTPDLRLIVEKLASAYGLGISRYFGEVDIKSMYSDPIDSKKDSLYKILSNLDSHSINLLVCHIGKNNDELQAMIDLNSFGLSDMSKHRNAELDALVAAKRDNIFMKNNIQLINYDFLIKEAELKNMKSPADSGY